MRTMTAIQSVRRHPTHKYRWTSGAVAVGAAVVVTLAVVPNGAWGSGIIPPRSFPLIWHAPFSAAITNLTHSKTLTSCAGAKLTTAPFFNSKIGKGGFAGLTTASACGNSTAVAISEFGLTVGIYTDNPRTATAVFLNWTVGTELAAFVRGVACTPFSSTYTCDAVAMANLTASASVSYTVGANRNYTFHTSPMIGGANFSVTAFTDSSCSAGACSNTSSPSVGSNFSQAIHSYFRPGSTMGHRSIHVTFTVVGYVVCELVATGATFSAGSVMASMETAAAPSGIVVATLTIT